MSVYFLIKFSFVYEVNPITLIFKYFRIWEAIIPVAPAAVDNKTVSLRFGLMV